MGYSVEKALRGPRLPSYLRRQLCKFLEVEVGILLRFLRFDDHRLVLVSQFAGDTGVFVRLIECVRENDEWTSRIARF